jgi:hypothetical protein
MELAVLAGVGLAACRNERNTKHGNKPQRRGRLTGTLLAGVTGITV